MNGNCHCLGVHVFARNCQVLVAILLAIQIKKVCVEEKEEDDTFGLVTNVEQTREDLKDASHMWLTDL